jgi:hypothetical protein
MASIDYEGLVAVVTAWPSLPEYIRRAILMLLRSGQVVERTLD